MTSTEQNLQKLLQFIAMTNNEKPTLPSSLPIDQLVRQYLNDNDFTIVNTRQQNFFKTNQFPETINHYYQIWIKHQTFNKNILDFDDFVTYWVDHDENIIVQSSWNRCDTEETYQEIKPSDIFLRKRKGKKVPQFFHENILKIDQSMLCEKKEIEPVFKKQKNRIGYLKKPQKKFEEVDYSPYENMTSQQYLKKYFLYFAKQKLESTNNYTFSSYQSYYNTICLRKWMKYLKDIGLLNYKSRFNVRKAQQIFQKHQNQCRVLDFQKFKNAVLMSLKLLFDNDSEQVDSKGFQLIGIKNIQNFVKKFKSLNVTVPLKVLKAKNEQISTNYSSITFEKKVLTEPDTSTSMLQKTNEPKSQKHFFVQKNSLQNQIQKIVEKKLHEKQLAPISDKIHTSMPFSPKKTIYSPEKKILNKTKEKPACFFQDIKTINEDDPYLKRYNNKENLIKFEYIVSRIDERIDKVTNKY